MGEEYGNGLFCGRAREGAVQVVAPELQAHGSDRGGGDGVGDAGCFDVEGAEGEVGGLGGGWDEGEEGVGGRVEFPVRCETGLTVVGIEDGCRASYWRRPEQ